MAHGITPHARVIWGTNTGNGGFVQMTTAAAKHAARVVRWPDTLPADDAPFMAWELIRARTWYERDRGGQWVRLPSALIRDRVGDCKSTAVTIAALAAAAGWPVVLRFVGYRDRPYLSHVYAVVDGVPVDPLLPFGSQVVHSHGIDIRIA